MFRLNRMTEYALIALRQLHEKRVENRSLSARELAELEGLPFEITAKTLQRLRDAGYIRSAQGAKGGYLLTCDLQSVTFSQFLEAVEEKANLATHLEECCQGQCRCEYQARCSIKPFMISVNRRIRKFLETVPLSELLAGTRAPQSKVHFWEANP